MGVEPEKQPPHDDLLGFRNRLIVGVVFAGLYIVTFGPRTGWLAGAFIGVLFAIGSIARGDVAPGIVGGILAGILCFLVLRQISERQWARIREWERRNPSAGA